MAKGWLDEFFVGCAIFVAVAAITDWYIGKSGRGKIREKVGDFWLRMEITPYQTIIFDSIKEFSRIIESIFGTRILSIRRMFASAVYTTASFLLAIIIFLIQNGTSHLFFRLFVSIDILFFIFPVLILADFFSIAATIKLYALASAGKIKVRILAPIFSVLFVVSISSLFLGVWIWIMLKYIFYICNPRTGECEVSFFAPFFIGGAIGIVFLSALVPIALHALQLIFIILAKLFRGPMRAVSMVVLLRLEESDKGVLTQLSIAVAALLKVGQEIVKYLKG